MSQKKSSDNDLPGKRSNDKKVGALRRTNDPFRAALDETLAVVITDNQGTFIDANKKFCEISKYSRDEILGNKSSPIYKQLQDNGFFEPYRNLSSIDKIWHGQLSNRAKDNSIF